MPRTGESQEDLELLMRSGAGDGLESEVGCGGAVLGAPLVEEASVAEGDVVRRSMPRLRRRGRSIGQSLRARHSCRWEFRQRRSGPHHRATQCAIFHSERRRRGRGRERLRRVRCRRRLRSRFRRGACGGLRRARNREGVCGLMSSGRHSFECGESLCGRASGGPGCRRGCCSRSCAG